jgi:hypothetical protein
MVRLFCNLAFFMPGLATGNGVLRIKYGRTRFPLPGAVLSIPNFYRRDIHPLL